MPFLADYDALDTEARGADTIRAAKSQLLLQWLQARPQELFAELREHRPILESPVATVVTKYADVLEVLRRDQAFSVAPYTANIERVVGPFVLGMDNTPRYQHDISILRLVVRPEDLNRIRSFVARATDEVLEPARSHGRLDLVRDLSRIVPARLMGHYFGVTGPDEETLLRWTRAMYYDIFLNLRGLPEAREAAATAGSEMKAHLDRVIASRRAAVQAREVVPDDVLTRLLRMQCTPEASFDDAAIRDNLIGLVVGAVDTTSKAMVHAIDELLRRPDSLRAAADAARSAEDDLLTHYIYEALRFNPQSNVLQRISVQPYTLAKGTERQADIRTGTVVFVALMSAMFDEDHVDVPQEFRTDRSLDFEYLHFGEGLHACLGRFIAKAMIVEMSKRLLGAGELRRAEGATGEVRYGGYGLLPDALELELTA